MAKGALVKKADVETQLKEAVTKARGEWDTERKTIAARVTSLASLSLPTPEESMISGTEDEFKARCDKAKDRAAKVSGYKVAPERLMTLCWKVDDATFDTTIELLKENAATQKASPAPVGGSKPNASATKPTLFGI